MRIVEVIILIILFPIWIPLWLMLNISYYLYISIENLMEMLDSLVNKFLDEVVPQLKDK